jgi:hypothetical protein
MIGDELPDSADLTDDDRGGRFSVMARRAGGRGPVTAMTISRQLGSLDRTIGREAAQRLGYSMIWRELINQAASRAEAFEIASATIDDLRLLYVRPFLHGCWAYLPTSLLRTGFHPPLHRQRLIALGVA